MKPDVESTKIQLADSLVALLQKRSLEKITVEDICHHCHLSKRTFYNYFQDKNALVSYVWEQILEKSMYTGETPNTLEEYLNLVTMYGDLLGDFFPKAYEYTGQNNLLETIYRTSMKSHLALIRANGWEDRIDNEIMQLLRFYIHGMLGYSQEMVLLHRQYKADKIIDEQYFTGTQSMVFLPEKLRPLILTVNPDRKAE